MTLDKMAIVEERLLDALDEFFDCQVELGAEPVQAGRITRNKVFQYIRVKLGLDGEDKE
jgi:hypothetical protein